MKTMTCKDLGGACDEKFHAPTFDAMANISKAHGTKMAEAKDEAHLEAMNEMMKLMTDPSAMQAWFQSKKELFDSLPEN